MTISSKATLLSDLEIQQALKVIGETQSGTYELKTLFGAEWKNVPSPTTYGKRFKATVENGLLPGIEHEDLQTDNHNLYKIL